MAQDEWASVRDSLTAEWEAGVDWVTYIARTPSASAELIRLACAIRDEAVDPAEKKRKFNLGGYAGWSQGSVSLGLRGHAAMVQLSGKTADGHWTRLAPLSGAPTRLDVQTTLLLPTAQETWYKRPLRLSTRRTTRPRSSPLLRGWRTDTRGRAHGTAGDRTEPRYLRVYDKGTESGAYPRGRLWRLELEAKGTLAPRLWDDLAESSSVSQWCYNTVCEQWKLSGLHWPLGESTRGSYGITAPRREPSASDRLAEWMVVSVRPAVARLLTTHSKAEIRRLLDLDDDAGIPEA